MSRNTDFIKKWLSATYFESLNQTSLGFNIEQEGSVLIHNYSIDETSDSTIYSENESFTSCHDTLYSWSPQDEKSLFYLKYPWVSNKNTDITPTPKPARRVLRGEDGDKIDNSFSTQSLKLNYTGRLNDLPSIDSVLDPADNFDESARH